MKRITALLLALLLVMGSVLIPAAAENELFEEKAPALTEEAGEEDAPEAAGAEEKEIVSPEEPIVMISSDYHMDRAVRNAKEGGFSQVMRLPAPSAFLAYGANMLSEVVLDLNDLTSR